MCYGPTEAEEGSDFSSYSLQEKEKPQREQHKKGPRPEERCGSVLSFFFLTARLSAVPTVALALEVCAEKAQLHLAGGSAHFEVAVQTADAVRCGAEVEVHVAVLRFPQTAAVGFAHYLTAFLRSGGHVQQVPTQWSLQVLIQDRAASLWGGGKTTVDSSPHGPNELRIYDTYLVAGVGGAPPEDYTSCSKRDALTNGGDQVGLKQESRLKKINKKLPSEVPALVSKACQLTSVRRVI